MTDIAKHIRIFNMEPDDNFVTKRIAAIKAVEEVFRKYTLIDDIISLANKISESIHNPENLDSSISAVVEKALKKQSASFVADGESLQVSACAIIASLEALNRSKPSKGTKLTITDVLAISMWSSLSFQNAVTEKPKLEALRTEILNEAKNVVHNDSFTTRDRLSIAELKTITASDEQGILVDNIVKTISPILEGFKTNAILDREEIDVLWWKLNGWSEIAEIEYKSLNNVQRAIIQAVDLAILLKRLPHEAHYRLASSSVGDLSYNADEIVDQMGDLLPSLSDYIKKFQTVNANPEVFPLFRILLSNKEEQIPFSETKRTISEWAGRALLEGTIINLGKFLNNG